MHSQKCILLGAEHLRATDFKAIPFLRPRKLLSGKTVIPGDHAGTSLPRGNPKSLGNPEFSEYINNKTLFMGNIKSAHPAFCPVPQ